MAVKGKIIVISAPSGAGKTTIIKNILSDFPDIIFSVSATTRKRRDGEIDGVDYFFLSEDEFKRKIEAGEFIEWEKCYDYYYGTLKEFINKTLETGKSVLLEVDVKGALNIKKIYPGSELIFIVPPSLEELKTRLERRNSDTDEDISKRIKRAEMEMALQDEFNYLVINTDLDKAIREVKEIIEKIRSNNGNTAN